MFGGTFAGRRVLVTGHTGFKGAWLASWLERLAPRSRDNRWSRRPSQTCSTPRDSTPTCITSSPMSGTATA
jgi:CDP-glucose 4,6-dehydratase